MQERAQELTAAERRGVLHPKTSTWGQAGGEAVTGMC